MLNHDEYMIEWYIKMVKFYFEIERIYHQKKNEKGKSIERWRRKATSL